MGVVDGRGARDDLGGARVEEAEVEGELLDGVEAALLPADVVAQDVVVRGA